MIKSKVKVHLRLLGASAAFALVCPAFADDSEWVYDTSRRDVPAPATDEAEIGGLDAKARGFDDSNTTSVDKWFWTWCFSNELQVLFDPPGMGIFIK